MVSVHLVGMVIAEAEEILTIRRLVLPELDAVQDGSSSASGSL